MLGDITPDLPPAADQTCGGRADLTETVDLVLSFFFGHAGHVGNLSDDNGGGTFVSLSSNGRLQNNEMSRPIWDCCG